MLALIAKLITFLAPLPLAGSNPLNSETVSSRSLPFWSEIEKRVRADLSGCQGNLAVAFCLRTVRPAMCHGPPSPLFPAGSATACDPARQQPAADLLRSGGLRALSRLARRGCDGARFGRARLCPDDQSCPPADLAARRREHPAHPAIAPTRAGCWAARASASAWPGSQAGAPSRCRAAGRTRSGTERARKRRDKSTLTLIRRRRGPLLIADCHGDHWRRSRSSPSPLNVGDRQ